MPELEPVTSAHLPVNLGRFSIVPPGRDVRESEFKDALFAAWQENRFSGLLVGGYIVVEADGYDSAVSKLNACPIFENGGSVEVREVLPVQA